MKLLLTSIFLTVAGCTATIIGSASTKNYGTFSEGPIWLMNIGAVLFIVGFGTFLLSLGMRKWRSKK